MCVSLLLLACFGLRLSKTYILLRLNVGLLSLFDVHAIRGFISIEN